MSHVPSNAPSIGAESFSLVVGGPLFQLWRRTGLSGDGLELLYRRLFFFFILTWVPLLAFSLADGRAWGPSLRLPFLRDIEMHARLLLSLPLMLYAELLVEQRMRPLVGQFVTCGLIPDLARPVFDAALSAARDMRNSLAPELALLACVYVVGWFGEALLTRSTWLQWIFRVGVGPTACYEKDDPSTASLFALGDSC